MAPTSNGTARRADRGRGNTSHSRRNAVTNAGVNRGQSTNYRGSNRAMGPHRRRANTDRARYQSSRPSLATRITYGGTGTGNQTARSHTATSYLQSANGDDDLRDGLEDPAERASFQRLETAKHNTAAPEGSTMSSFSPDVDVDVGINIGIDGMLFGCQQNIKFSQPSALFCGSQPTQQINEPRSPIRPASQSYTSPPIRMVFLPQHKVCIVSQRCPGWLHHRHPGTSDQCLVTSSPGERHFTHVFLNLQHFLLTRHRPSSPKRVTPPRRFDLRPFPSAWLIKAPLLLLQTATSVLQTQSVQ